MLPLRYLWLIITMENALMYGACKSQMHVRFLAIGSFSKDYGNGKENVT